MFTIGMPAFNRAGVISRAIDSILAQTFDDFELVIVDDGSTDATFEIAGSYRDPRIKVVGRGHLGAAAARNAAVAVGSAPWVTFLDSDDEARPQWLEALNESAAPGVAVVSCAALNVLPSRRTEVKPPEPILPFFPNVTANFRYGGTYTIRRTVFDSVGGFTLGLQCSQHTDLGLRIAERLEGRAFATQNETLIVRYAGTENSIRGNARALLEGSQQLLSIHAHLYERDLRARSRARYRVSARARRVGELETAREFALKAWRDDPAYTKALAGLVYASLMQPLDRFKSGRAR